MMSLLQTSSFSLYKMLIDELEWYGLLAMFFFMFGPILTAPNHYRGSIDEQVMQCYISPNLF